MKCLCRSQSSKIYLFFGKFCLLVFGASHKRAGFFVLVFLRTHVKLFRKSPVWRHLVVNDLAFYLELDLRSQRFHLWR